MFPFIRHCGQVGLLCAIGLATIRPVAAEEPPPKVEAVTPDMTVRLRLDPFYQRHLSVRGLSIVSSVMVNDGPFLEAARIVDGFFANREDIRAELVNLGIRVVLLAADEQASQLPEYARFGREASLFNTARGYGPTPDFRLIVCCESNLAGRDDDVYFGECVLVHELGHAVQAAMQAKLDPGFDRRLKTAYDNAMRAGLWRERYAATNPEEYWAVGVQSYFDSTDDEINSREKLAKYDVALHGLVDGVFRQSPWRYVPHDGKVRRRGVEMELRIENRTNQTAKVRLMTADGLQDYTEIPVDRDAVGKLYSGLWMSATFSDGRHAERFIVPARDAVWTLR